MKNFYVTFAGNRVVDFLDRHKRNFIMCSMETS